MTTFEQLINLETPDSTSTSIKLLILLTLLTLAPSFLILMTCFTRVVVVLSFIRPALGTQQTPPNQLIVGLALFITLFVMSPVLSDLNENALKPYLDDKISQDEAFDEASGTMKEFMSKYTRQEDLQLFLKYGNYEQPETLDDVPLLALVPAYAISELKTAFQIGFMIFLPFLIIDMVVASVLMSMGMMMLPPVMIALPFKLLLFVLVDGWHLIVESLLRSM
ncbi:MAG: flagellar type III secretion system pore protein FliP [Exiguobacterium sp.]|jgi:flagellar biosynthetic protein FliP|uniref:Flagellar biosynthetic protein FliP n=2 Tax=Exiguobacterium TaxID=33986 RepID=C4L637_EXISA|nr:MULTISPECIES: flagellar type III secretion system pore protein FliP [Exiguobacterium]ACQ71843.1 flagellar biosynthetic protein FliP [Exiguobacterium sp. AT1b]MBQ6459656.1 flagellar type III secretion system pore protein FliP [Exiguobacterium sp.]MBR2076771.1 flagellar type III secretion system pore protein FliP [Exiguobacterium sp.]MBR3061832.1 flagellar type III secretion system pore protein FliP [Exiguobacterium sp.]MBR3216899.1 flagellar type III secretion system pore protein FliP [Exigu